MGLRPPSAIHRVGSLESMPNVYPAHTQVYMNRLVPDDVA
jgi:hypothetical protein